MCRWMAYSGEAVPLELFLFQAEHNLIDQSMSSRSAETPTNGDGFGLGWFNPRLEGQLGPSTRVVVSEPVGVFPQVWVEVPQSSLVVVDGKDLAIRPFAPEA